MKTSLDQVYKPSEDVVARDIHGEFIIIPITSGIGDLEDEIYALNQTGRAIWGKLDGRRRLKEAVEELTSDFKGPAEEIEDDVLGLVKELLRRRMLVAVKRG